MRFPSSSSDGGMRRRIFRLWHGFGQQLLQILAGGRLHPAPQDFTQASDNPWRNILTLNRAAEKSLQRCGALIGNPARDNQIEVTQVGRNIIGKSVRRDR